MLGALRGTAALALGGLAGATAFLFPAALAGFRIFPDDPATAGRIAGGVFDAYAPLAWGLAGVGVVALVVARLRGAARTGLPLGAAAVAVAALAGWLLVLRPIVDTAGRDRREAPTADARAAADATFHRWHGVSLALAFATLLAAAVAGASATRLGPSSPKP